MKRVFCFTVLAALVAAPCFGSGDEPTKLVYPMTAAETELDNSTPAKRITPPTREETEYDPVTPLGQIRDVRESLDKLERQQDEILETVGKMRTADNQNLLPLLEKSARNQDAIGANVDSILASTRTLGDKIVALQRTTEDLRKTVEAAQKTAASVERIRTSRWTDCAVIAILVLICLQIVWKFGATIVAWLNDRARKLQEMKDAYELAKKQLAEAKEKE